MQTYEQIFGQLGRKLDQGYLTGLEKNEEFAKVVETCICKTIDESGQDLREAASDYPALKVAYRCDSIEAVNNAMDNGGSAEVLNAVIATADALEPQFCVVFNVTVKGMTSEEVDQMDGEMILLGEK